jgi:hypothetical protein
MRSQTFSKTESPYRSVGWAAIASGIIGILAAACLIKAVTTRTSIVLSNSVNLLFRAHDVGIILQYLLMIPVAFALQRLSRQRPPGMGRAMLATAVGALSFVILILLLVFPKIVPDDYYPVPQGVFGVWLILVNWRMRGIFSPGLRWFGMVVGLGLTLVGIFPLGYAIFVSPVIFHIPPIQPIDHDTLANYILHWIIYVGSFMGVFPLPFWTLLLGRRLLREKSIQY